MAAVTPAGPAPRRSPRPRGHPPARGRPGGPRRPRRDRPRAESASPANRSGPSPGRGSTPRGEAPRRAPRRALPLPQDSPPPTRSRLSRASPMLSTWTWASVRPGKTALPARAMRRVAGPACFSISASLPTATIRPPRTATACARGSALSSVTTTPPVSTRSARGAVVSPDTCSRAPISALAARRPMARNSTPPNSSASFIAYRLLRSPNRGTCWRSATNGQGWRAAPLARRGGAPLRSGAA